MGRASSISGRMGGTSGFRSNSSLENLLMQGNNYREENKIIVLLRIFIKNAF